MNCACLTVFLLPVLARFDNFLPKHSLYLPTKIGERSVTLISRYDTGPSNSFHLRAVRFSLDRMNPTAWMLIEKSTRSSSTTVLSFVGIAPDPFWSRTRLPGGRPKA